MSKLIEARQVRKEKKATILTSVDTVRDAVNIGNSLLNAWTQEGLDDARVDQLAGIIDHLDGLLNSQPDQMMGEGVSSVEEYFDDSKSPETARQVKNEVDMIANWRREARPAQVTQQTPAAQPAAEPAMAMASDEKAAAGSADAAFVTDRDENGQPKAPEKAEVPRLAGRKKKEAEDPAAAAAPAAPPAAPAAAAPVPPPPAPVAPTGDGTLDTLFESLPSEFIAKLVKDLTGIEGFEANKSVQAAVERLAEILKNRPVEAAPAPGAQTASSKKAAPSIHDLKKFGGLNLVGFEVDAAEEKVAVAPPGREDQVKALKKEDVDNPYAVAWDSYNKSKGGSADKEAFRVAFKAGADAIIAHVTKSASGNAGSWFVSDQDTMDVTDGGSRVPEIAEAHAERDDKTGIKRPETTAPIKLAADMSTSKAVKEAERLGQTLKQMYLDAKPLTEANSSRPVREAVEAIFRAGDMFNEATKTLNKQLMQEEEAEQAEKIRTKNEKKSSAFGGLKLVAAE